jgi:hypothetical protein
MAPLSRQQCIERAIALEIDADDAITGTRQMMLALAKEWRDLAAEAPDQPLQPVSKLETGCPGIQIRVTDLGQIRHIRE